MRTALERELYFQEIAFSTLAGFWHDFPFKIRPFLGPQNPVSDVLFRLGWRLGLLWPPLASLGLPLASLWPPFGLPLASLGLPLAASWPPCGLPWSPLGLSLAFLGSPLASLWPPLGLSWHLLGVSQASLGIFDLIWPPFDFPHDNLRLGWVSQSG